MDLLLLVCVPERNISRHRLLFYIWTFSTTLLWKKYTLIKVRVNTLTRKRIFLTIAPNIDLSINLFYLITSFINPNETTYDHIFNKKKWKVTLNIPCSNIEGCFILNLTNPSLQLWRIFFYIILRIHFWRKKMNLTNYLFCIFFLDLKFLHKFSITIQFKTLKNHNGYHLP